MTAPTMYRPSTKRTVRRAAGTRPPPQRAGLVAGASAVLGALAVMVGVVGAGPAVLAPARADSSDGSAGGLLGGLGMGSAGSPDGSAGGILGGLGTGNGGSPDAAAALGQSVCPMLVKPGASFVSIASQMMGNSPIPPGMVEMVATMAMQSQCPGFIESLAHGQMPAALQGLGGNSAMSLPGLSPGAGPIPNMPFQLPGAAPAAGNPLQLPGF